MCNVLNQSECLMQLASETTELLFQFSLGKQCFNKSTAFSVSINKSFQILMKEEWNIWVQKEAHCYGTYWMKTKINISSCIHVDEEFVMVVGGIRSDIVIKSLKKCSTSNTMGLRMTLSLNILDPMIMPRLNFILFYFFCFSLY